MIPFGDVLVVGDRVINLQVAPLDVGVLYVLAMVSLGVYGVVLGGWASNNRWSLLGGIRGSAQMISYELAMGLAIVAMILTYGTLDLQAMARAQGELLFGWLPAWGILYQPVAFLIFLCAGIAESKRVPFDLPECESELISGYFTEYSGVKYLMFFMTDFVEVIIVSGLVTTLFFGGWQVPYLIRDGFHSPWGASIALPCLLVVVLLQVGVLRRQGGLLLLVPDHDPLDPAALPLRPAHATWAGRACCRSRSPNVVGDGGRHLWPAGQLT